MGKSGEGGGITAGQEITTLSEISFGFPALFPPHAGKENTKKKLPVLKNYGRKQI